MAVECPVDGCTYNTGDVQPVVAAALITAHALNHKAPAEPVLAARVEKVKRPSVSSAGSTEDWLYFKSRWSDYVAATRLKGPDCVIQLLECCNEQLRRDLTRNAGGSLIAMSKDEVLIAIRRLAVREESTMVPPQHASRPRRARTSIRCQTPWSGWSVQVCSPWLTVTWKRS